MPCPYSTLSATNTHCPVHIITCQPQIHNALSIQYSVGHKSTMSWSIEYSVSHKSTMSFPYSTLSATNPQCPVHIVLCQPQCPVHIVICQPQCPVIQCYSVSHKYHNASFRCYSVSHKSHNALWPKLIFSSNNSPTNVCHCCTVLITDCVTIKVPILLSTLYVIHKVLPQSTDYHLDCPKQDPN
jgi:hypothetical protein